jgi:hypothetical protein
MKINIWWQEYGDGIATVKATANIAKLPHK